MDTNLAATIRDWVMLLSGGREGGEELLVEECWRGTEKEPSGWREGGAGGDAAETERLLCDAARRLVADSSVSQEKDDAGESAGGEGGNTTALSLCMLRLREAKGDWALAGGEWRRLYSEGCLLKAVEICRAGLLPGKGNAESVCPGVFEAGRWETVCEEDLAASLRLCDLGIIALLGKKCYFGTSGLAFLDRDPSIANAPYEASVDGENDNDTADEHYAHNPSLGDSPKRAAQQGVGQGDFRQLHQRVAAVLHSELHTRKAPSTSVSDSWGPPASRKRPRPCDCSKGGRYACACVSGWLTFGDVVLNEHRVGVGTCVRSLGAGDVEELGKCVAR